ncbi:NmrA family NAD(P)-binding protein [Streptomyces sp. NPDC001985]|uniref:NmrA family NAD(P)-binding protein n=1 Tax=Streptomyces sp. NPDC001985 TaxID=3154406 RepID=UPI00331739D0
MTTDEILVLGATGKTGRRVVGLLRAEGRKVRAASRSGEVTFDWGRPETWAAAVDGASALFLVAPEDPSPVDALVKQAAAAGVSRFVALSGRGLEHAPGDFGADMLEGERAVRESGAAWTVIRPNNFNQNFDEYIWREPLRAGRLALPAGATGAAPEPFVDVDDVAAVAALLLTAEGGEHDGRAYELSGPRGLSFGEAVDIMARASGRPMVYEELTPEEYTAELLEQGAPPEVAEGMNALFTAVRSGLISRPVDGVRELLGRDPIAFETFAERAARAGAWS